MSNALQQSVNALKSNRHFVLVAGTNKITKVPIDTFGILVKILQEWGMRLEHSFEYEIIKNALKITRHQTSDIIRYDSVAVLRKG
jgi:hypothetical protein